MIQWLRTLFGMAPATPAARRRSLVSRLTDPTPAESAAMASASETLARHARLEEAIATHKAQVADEKARGTQARQEHQSAIAESTIALERAGKQHTTRRQVREDPFNVADLARQEARRRHEA